MIHKDVRSIAWLFFDKFAKTLLNLFVYVYVAKSIGPDAFGGLSLALGLYSVLSIIAALGLDTIAVRVFSSPLGYSNDTVSALVFMRVLSGVGVVVASAIYFLFIDTSIGSYLGIDAIVASSLIYNVCAIFNAKKQSDGDFKKIVLIQLAVAYAIAIVRIAAVKSGVGVWGLAWIAHFEVLALNIAIFAFTPHLWALRLSIPNWSLVWQLLCEAAPILVANVAIILYMRIDQFMINSLASMSEVGRYSIAMRFCEVWYFIPMSVGAVLFPRLVRLNCDGQSGRDLLSAANRCLTFAAIALMLASSLVMLVASDYVFGSQYAGVGVVAAIYNMSLVFVFQGVLRGYYLTSIGEGRFLLGASLLGLVVNVLMNSILIPRFGASGAAVATVLGQFMSVFFTSFIYKKIRWYGNMQVSSLWAIFSPVKATRDLLKIRELGAT